MKTVTKFNVWRSKGFVTFEFPVPGGSIDYSFPTQYLTDVGRLLKTARQDSYGATLRGDLPVGQHETEQFFLWVYSGKNDGVRWVCVKFERRGICSKVYMTRSCAKRLHRRISWLNRPAPMLPHQEGQFREQGQPAPLASSY